MVKFTKSRKRRPLFFVLQLAHEAAVQSIVLLQHPEGVLPLDSTAPSKTLAVLGPLGNMTDAFTGDHAPKACPGSAPAGFGNQSHAVKTATWCLRTALQEITKANAGGKTTFAAGCEGITEHGGKFDDPNCATEDNATAVATASASDTVVMILGLVTTRVPHQGGPGDTNSESRDRATIGLPGRQAALAEAVIAVGKPTILVVVGGGSVSVDFAKGKPHVAVVAAGFGGEAGASALSSVLFGESTPSARLAHTICNQASQRAVGPNPGVGNFLGFVSMSTRARHGGALCVQTSTRKRVDCRQLIVERLCL